jgi:ribonuclease HII
MFVAGLDEVGRGCLAGPVVAAAVILPGGYKNASIKDSKRLTTAQRERAASIIRRDSIAFAIAEIPAEQIDKVNILNATFQAMHAAITQLHIKPHMLLVDGDRFTPYPGIPHRCIIRGDSSVVSIAAASILAKTYRDQLMVNLSNQYPLYRWAINKGYATKQHRTAIVTHGYSPYHRLTFTVKP